MLFRFLLAVSLGMLFARPGIAQEKNPFGRVLGARRTDRMMADYHIRRAEQKVARLRAAYPPARFIASADAIRKALANTFLMPPAGGKAEATLLGTSELDGVRVERQLLNLRPGVTSPALVFLPPSYTSTKRYPAILMLPGHGDPTWSPSVQNRCLSFVKRGYIVLFVQPFGQAERGENPAWNEFHDAQALGYLLTAGQSLLGIIMADHQAELTYLVSRADVAPERVAVTGVSMGGTHTLWLSAIDTRVRAAVAVGVPPEYQPNWSFRHHGMCDLMAGVYDVADMSMMQALSAPRPLMHIYPDSERPLKDEAARDFLEGRLNYEEALKNHAMDDRQIADMHRYEHDVYAALKAPDAYADRIYSGPHDYNQPMREAAAGWFAHYLLGARSDDSIPEPAFTPVTDMAKAVSLLHAWPSGDRPREVLSPTAYVQRETAALHAKLPEPPKEKEAWPASRAALQASVKKLLGAPLASPDADVKEVGTARAERSAVAHKIVVRPEPGIELPMLLFEPRGRDDGRLVVLLHSGGMAVTADSEERRALTAAGAWVLCVDLRGMGETRYDQEAGGYLGFRDYDIAIAAIKLGETLAGYWTKDLLAAIQAARGIAGEGQKIVVRGAMEAGLVAILAAGQSDIIQEVETEGLLASCFSAKGYGLPFAYADQNNNSVVRSRKLGGYGSMVPCIPHLLTAADIPQLAALVAPRLLSLRESRWASGDPLSAKEAAEAFAWTRAVYRLCGAEKALRLED